MDKHTRENWQKIKDHLESVGATDNHYYRRAVKITGGEADSFDDRAAGLPDIFGA